MIRSPRPDRGEKRACPENSQMLGVPPETRVAAANAVETASGVPAMTIRRLYEKLSPFLDCELVGTGP